MRNGSIKYISMQNWMAYTGPVTLVASPGVNIIAASNGSGKSAIVCAIALSLGFDVDILSRGDNIRSFVKRGCMNSVLRVGLSDDKSKGGTAEIERKITLTENPSTADQKPNSKDNSSQSFDSFKRKTSVKNEWFLNGKNVNLEAIRSLYKRLNIQLDNLLTFLAQANVGKFAAMTQQDLFRSTLNAINPNYVYEFDELVELSHKLKCKVSEFKSLEQQLHSSNAKLLQLKHFSDTIVKVKDASLYRNIVKLKLFQLKLTNINKGHENTRRRIGETNNEIFAHQSKHNKLQARHDQMKASIDTILDQSNSQLNEASKLMDNDGSNLKTNNLSDTSENEPLEKAFYDSLSLLKTFANDYKRSQSKPLISEDSVESLKNKISSIQAEIDSIKSKMLSSNELVESIARCKVNEETLRYKMRRYTSKSHLNFNDLQFESLLNNLSYAKRENILKYLNFCKSRSKTPHKFLINDIKVKGTLHSAILEDSIGKYLDCVLLTSSEYESNLKLLKDFKLPIVTAPNFKNVLCKVTQKMRSFGVTHFLHEIFQASETTLQCLSSLTQINETFIVDEKFYSENFLKKGKASETQFNNFYSSMTSEIGLQLGKKVNTLKYFIGNKKHLYKNFPESKYFTDSQITISTTPKAILDYANFGDGSNDKEIQALQNQIDLAVNELYTLNKKLNENNDLNRHLNRKLFALSKQQISLEKSLRAISSTQQDTSKKRDWPAELEKLKTDRLNVINKSIVESANNLMAKLQKASLIREQLQKGNDLYEQYSNRLLDLNDLKDLLSKSTSTLEDLKSSQTLLHNTFEEQKERIKTYKKTISEIKEAIKSSEQLFDSSYFNEEQTKPFAQVRKDFENKLINFTEGDLENELLKAEEQLKKLENDDYEEIQLIKMIQEERTNNEKYKCSMDELSNEISTLTNQRNDRFTSWHAQVTTIIKEIDTKFGNYMKYIGDGSDGQVRLEVDVEKIKESKLRILVKFEREKDLLPLTTSYQSGGERGVTTMVYILSVQRLTNNPFFVIDEINQGLDSHYERKIMKLLLSSVDHPVNRSKSDNVPSESNSKLSGPQYFILTPQLISGYDLSNATLHFPLNGPGVKQGLTL